jgi:hydroxyacylglutathione hydrolase
MRVFQIAVGPMQNFSYLVMDEETKEAIAVDSGWEIDPIVERAEEEKMEVRYAVATHHHFDHVKTIGALAEALGAEVAAHESSTVTSKVRLKDGDVLSLGKGRVEVLHTPGHTVDSICLYDRSHLFTGDTLFIGYWGRTDLPGGSAETLYSSLHERIMALPGETVIYPGHDYGEVPSRTLAEEARANPALRARSVREFVGLHQD